MTPHESADSSAAKPKMVNKRVFTLQPGTGKSVGLGIFTGEALPEYEITAQPALDEFLGISRERVPLDSNRSWLLYQFHNFGSKPYEVTVRRTEKPGPHGANS